VITILSLSVTVSLCLINVSLFYTFYVYFLFRVFYNVPLGLFYFSSVHFFVYLCSHLFNAMLACASGMCCNKLMLMLMLYVLHFAFQMNVSISLVLLCFCVLPSSK